MPIGAPVGRMIGDQRECAVVEIAAVVGLADVEVARPLRSLLGPVRAVGRDNR